ncbi:MAG TPA: hypothetical protein PK052_06340 [Anaerohalosphaeraceae bacterium]|nr:hypothetical protein [Phycisphaerae bacterium]HOL31586.1 hypothetical protein [Anaerohalosphaeraceae bacterium]HOM75587.1 hypothetical protein [Anaerohalosphaeraceae bacterium]HPC63515.1 hypothetical protein [Anaerohalosphaeraceae bacterium]HPO69548.1 hypothetical protein [Anaerohalosphaeraceae bacterium]
MNARLNSGKLGLCILAGIVLTGCPIQKRLPIPQQTFLLEVQRPQEEKPAALPVCLRISSCTPASPYAGTPFIYRTGPTVYEKDAYNAFLVSPDEQITEILNQWYLSSGLFSCPPKADTLRMEPHLNILHTDFRDKNKPAAVVQMNFRLTRTDKTCSCPIVLLNKTYSAEIPLLQTPAASDIVSGLSTALTSILQELERDVVQSIASTSL